VRRIKNSYLVTGPGHEASGLESCPLASELNSLQVPTGNPAQTEALTAPTVGAVDQVQSRQPLQVRPPPEYRQAASRRGAAAVELP
jgi:hypothetical protein